MGRGRGIRQDFGWIVFILLGGAQPTLSQSLTCLEASKAVVPVLRSKPIYGDWDGGVFHERPRQKSGWPAYMYAKPFEQGIKQAQIDEALAIAKRRLSGGFINRQQNYGNEAFLTGAESRLLFKVWNYLKFRRSKNTSSTTENADDESIRLLHSTLFSAHMGLVRAAARSARTKNRHDTQDELLAKGHDLLDRLLAGYDPYSNLEFPMFAKGALSRDFYTLAKREAQKRKRSRERPFGVDADGASEENNLADILRASNPKREQWNTLLKDTIARIEPELHPIESAILKRHFGLDDKPAETLDQIASSMDPPIANRTAIRRKASLLQKLREFLEREHSPSEIFEAE